jgi:regulator of sirC expression with transglutaminase-like and TPR domain
MLRSERVEDAIEVIDTMLLFAPKFTYLWWEKATLLARIDQIPKAILALEQFLVHGRGADSLYKASMLLQELRQSLN